MNVQLMARFLWKRQQLRRVARWTRLQIVDYQARELARLRNFADAHSPFYQKFHRGLTDRPLHDLPVLTKAMLMQHFDEAVTDRSLRLADVRTFLPRMQASERLQGRYWVASTSGSTGRPGIFVFDLAEWTAVLAGMARSADWAGMGVGLTHRTRMAVVASTVPWHMSAQTGPSVRSWFAPSISLDATAPLVDTVARLNAWQPHGLVAYPSLLRVLAEEQQAGRLHFQPRSIMTSGEVLTDDTRGRAAAVWGDIVFNVYAATETGSIASECTEHRGLHLYEDMVIVEIVDRDYRPVPPGVAGERVLVTVLSSRTLPLIRYEMSDTLRLAPEPCRCGMPFALLERVEGRAEDVLWFPGAAGGQVAVHPNVFHRVMDSVAAEEWQVVAYPDQLTVLVRAGAGAVDNVALVAAIRRELAAQGAQALAVSVERVEAIPRTPTGKAPLILRAPVGTTG